MNIKDCKYMKNEMKTKIVQIKATVNNEVWYVPIDPANLDYTEIMQQVRSGKITIAPADKK